ncbi:MAG TPA: hypothetical protein VFL42_10595 [Terriglobales bacterium]|jgi:hypothetical protein|nr:hypothetical protein [Terriglobales bacterium]
MAKGKKPTAQDAQLILQLYDLRREPVMRAARKFMVSEFWPQNYDEFKAVLTGYGTDHNAYLRQALTYWDMAAAMVLSGVINEELFFNSGSEPYFLWAKFGEYIPSGRNDFANPEFCLHLEELVKKPHGQRRVKGLQSRIAARRAQAAKSNH